MSRATYSTPRTLLVPPTATEVATALQRRLVRRYGGLVSREAASSTGAYVEGYVRSWVAEELSPFDVFELFYADERVRRWAASNARGDLHVADYFAPFCTEPFVRLCYRATPIQRFGEWVGRSLMEELAPELLSQPYERPWRTPRRKAVIAEASRRSRRQLSVRLQHRVRRAAQPSARLRWRKERRSGWFEAVRQQIRESCLDLATSELWQVVDRTAFERLTSTSVTPDERLAVIDGVLDAVTLFEYRHGAAGPWGKAENRAACGQTT